MEHASPCPSPSPGVCSNSCLLSQWCHPDIPSCFIPVSSCLQSFPAAESFLMRWLFASSGQSIEVSASVSASVSPSKECSRLISFRTDWFDLSDQGTLKSLPQHHISKASVLWSSAFFYGITWFEIRISKWSFWDKEREGAMCFCVFSSVNLPQENTSWTVWKTKCFNGAV